MQNNEYVKETDSRVDTAIVSLSNGSLDLDLVGVSHIGQRYYYEQILEFLSGHDLILYELIKKTPELMTLRDKAIFFNLRDGDKIHGQTVDAINELQYNTLFEVGEQYGLNEEKFSDIAEQIGVILQTDGIDYQNLPSNWVNYDLNQKEFSDSIPIFSVYNFQTFLRSLIQNSDKYASRVLINTLANFYSENFFNEDVNSGQLKAHVKRQDRVINGVENAEATHGIENVAILFGANHMPILEGRLHDKGYERTGISYITAVDKKPDIVGLLN